MSDNLPISLEQQWAEQAAKITCPVPLPEEEVTPIMANLLEERPYEPPPPKGAHKKRTTQGITIRESSDIKSGNSRASSRKGEDDDEDIDREEEQSSSHKGKSVASEK